MHALSSRFQSNKSKWLAAMSALVVMALAGCQASTPPINPVRFAGLRVMDFAPLPASNVDVYWYPGTTLAKDKQPSLTKVDANIHNLSFGSGAVYTDGIPAASSGTQYHYVVTRVNSPDVVDTEGNVMLYEGQNNTIAITAYATGPATAHFSALTFADAKGGKVSNTADPKSTFVRFMNMQPGSGKLVLRLNNPTSGEVIGSINGANGVDFSQISEYYAVQTGKYEDTSYALFLTPANSNNVIAQLTYQTYTAGSYFTVVYSGDTNRIQGELNKRTPQDTSQSVSDKIRLRVFPDDNIGADQTNPVDFAFRYNIINGVFIPGGYAPGINSMGFTINGDQIPKRHNFTAYPVDMFGAGGSNPHQLADTSWDIHFLSTSIPSHPIDFIGGYVDASDHTQIIFSKTDKNGIEPTTAHISADASISFIVTNGNVDPRKAVTINEVSIPTQVSMDSVTLVFVSGISLPIGGSDPKTTFHMTSTGGATYDTGPLTPGTGTETTIVKASDLGNSVTITDDVGTSNKISNLDAVSFHPVPGGIYEIVSVGVRPNVNGGNHLSKILVILTNGKEPVQ